MLENRKNYESNLEAQLAQWKADLDVIRAKANRAEVSAKIQFDKTITSLQEAHDEAGIRLGSLKAATDDAWEGLKLGTEKAWTGIRSQFHHSIPKS